MGALMKLFFILIFAMAALSCGKIKQPKKNSGLGGLFEGTAQPLSPSDVEKLKMICDAVAFKTARLSNDYRDFNFLYSSKPCSENNLSEPTPILAHIQNRGAGLAFYADSGASFPFSEIETSSSGIVSKICNSGGMDRVALDAGGLSMAFFNTADSSQCSSSSTTRCLLVKTGSLVAGTINYQHHTSDWIKFNVNGSDAYAGYFESRFVSSQVGCSGGKTVERNVTLVK